MLHFQVGLICLLVTALPALAGRATALHYLDQGLTHLEAGETDAASSKVEAALELCEQSGDLHGKAEAYLLLGLVKSREQEYRRAVEAYAQSVEILDSLGDRLGLVLVLMGRSEAQRQLGELDAAREGLDQALQWLRVMVSSGEPMSPESLRIFAIHHRMPPHFLAQIRRSFALAQPLLLRLVEAMLLTRVGAVHRDQQQYESALSSLEQARKLSQPLDLLEAFVLKELGMTRAALGRWDEAANDLEKAFVTARRIGDRDLQMEILDELADVDTSRGRPEAALLSYQRLLALTREAGNQRREAVTLNNLGFQYDLLGALASEINFPEGQAMARQVLGVIWFRLGRYDEARRELEASLDLFEAGGIYSDSGQAATHASLGVVEVMKDRPEAALDQLIQSVDLIEAIQEEISIAELVSVFSGSVPHEIYEILIYMNLRQRRLAPAFAYAERARARAFLKQIGNRRIDFHADTEKDLLTREQGLRRRMAELEEQLKASRIEISIEPSANVNQLQQSLKVARKSYQQLLLEIKEKHPEYASLVSVDTLDLARVQTELLDEQTTLIAYYAGARPLAWIIDRHGVVVVLTDLSGDELRQRVVHLNNMIRSRDFDFEAAGDLYRELIAPLEPHIRHRNLILVPHGVLHSLPFAALWNVETRRFLVEDYTLIHAPSASVLRFLAEKRSPNRGRLLVLGNPDGSLPRAEVEAETIAQLYGVRPLLQSEARESRLHTKEDEIDVLHLAAHGIYDAQNPLFSRIELAAGGGHDGHLEVHEIFNLDLAGTNLVVLSACDTALGEHTPGDELVGMTRAFLYAGSPAVVTSLWSVDDAASAALMESFYRHLRRASTSAQALRLAQLEVMGEERWRSPYFWAAFVLTGDPWWEGSGNDEPRQVNDTNLEEERRIP